MKIINLRAGAFQVAVMKEKLQAAQELGRTAGNERRDVSGPKKPMSMHGANDFPVTLGQLNRSDFGGTFEARKADGYHRSILTCRRGIKSLRILF